MIRQLWVLMAIGILFVGCSDMREKAKIRKTIHRYNELLVKGYQELNMNPLAEVATPDLARKAYHHMAALGEGGLRMEARIKNVDFEQIIITRQDSRATVKTRETWDFAHRDRKSDTIFYQETDFLYSMEYGLSNTGDRWIITSVNALESRSTSSISPTPVLPPQGRPVSRANEK